MPRSKSTNEALRLHSRDHIIAAARRLFAERGYFNCKVSDIAQAADMSQGNVYWYFHSKEDMLKAILSEGFQDSETLLTDVAAAPGSGRDKLVLLVDRYRGFCKDNSDFQTIVLSLFGHGGPEFMHKLGFDTAEIAGRFHAAMSKTLRQALGEGAMQPLVRDAPAMFFFSFFNGMMLTYGPAWKELPQELIVEAVLRLLGVKRVS
jgi:AcrR family transcriptional regulator